MKTIWIAAALAAAIAAGGQALADEPAGALLHLLVPGGPGGVVDLRARWLAEHLGPALNRPVIVEYKPGAGGNIAMAAGAHSAPDGNTLVIVHQGTMTVNPHLYAHPGYDPLTDFMPITRIGVSPLLLAVPRDSSIMTLSDLLRQAKERPGKLSYGSPGVGTPPYLEGELFKRAAGIDVVHVPYKSGSAALTDLLGGHISYTIEGTIVQLPQVQAGRLRALAVTGPHRLAALPDVPTLAEAGIADCEFLGWVGIAAPAGTPKPVVERLYTAIATVLHTPEAREWFDSFGAEPGTDPPEAFSQSIRAEHAKWGRLLHALGVRPE